MPATPDLLDAQATTKDIITYVRCSGGTFDNSYNDEPTSLLFHMQEVKVLDDEKFSLLSCRSLPSHREDYVPGKVYQMMDPRTCQPIDGMLFTSDQIYAMLWSMMYSARQAAKAAAAAAAAALPTPPVPETPNPMPPGGPEPPPAEDPPPENP